MKDYKHNLKPIGYVHTVYPEKFGIPHQSGIVNTPGYIELESPYNNPDALRGLEEYTHIWLIWQFSENVDSDGNWKWYPTVRPPRLGGNISKGVFATRSPFHPNELGLSCVEITSIEAGRIHISGADMMDGTPVLDIKPYISYSDSHPDARSSFANNADTGKLKVDIVKECNPAAAELHSEDLSTICELLSQDPRPHYQDDPNREYGMSYKNLNIRFRVEDETAFLIDIEG